MNRILRTDTPELNLAFLEERIKFIERLSPITAVARFEFTRKTEGRKITGEAYWLPAEAPWANLYPVLIKIKLNEPGTIEYPEFERYVEALPPIEILSWEEEFLLVLAHEMRHAEQYATSLANELGWDPYAMEVDAERFAYQAVFAFRSSQHRFKQAA